MTLENDSSSAAAFHGYEGPSIEYNDDAVPAQLSSDETGTDASSAGGADADRRRHPVRRQRDSVVSVSFEGTHGPPLGSLRRAASWRGLDDDAMPPVHEEELKSDGTASSASSSYGGSQLEAMSMTSEATMTVPERRVVPSSSARRADPLRTPALQNVVPSSSARLAAPLRTPALQNKTEEAFRETGRSQDDLECHSDDDDGNARHSGTHGSHKRRDRRHPNGDRSLSTASSSSRRQRNSSSYKGSRVISTTSTSKITLGKSRGSTDRCANNNSMDSSSAVALPRPNGTGHRRDQHAHGRGRSRTDVHVSSSVHNRALALENGAGDGDSDECVDNAARGVSGGYNSGYISSIQGGRSSSSSNISSRHGVGSIDATVSHESVDKANEHDSSSVVCSNTAATMTVKGAANTVTRFPSRTHACVDELPLQQEALAKHEGRRGRRLAAAAKKFTRSESQANLARPPRAAWNSSSSLGSRTTKFDSGSCSRRDSPNGQDFRGKSIHHCSSIKSHVDGTTLSADNSTTGPSATTTAHRDTRTSGASSLPRDGFERKLAIVPRRKTTTTAALSPRSGSGTHDGGSDRGTGISILTDFYVLEYLTG
jgi:hypothetical protein